VLIGISHLEGPTGYDRPPPTMEYNDISHPSTTTQTYGESDQITWIADLDPIEE